MQVKKQQLEPGMEQQTGSKLGKEFVSAVCCHLAHLTSMQSTSCEMLGWKKPKLEARLQGEISVISDMQMTLPFMAESEEELKSLLMKVKVESEKLKLIASGPITSWEIDGNNGNSVRLYFWGLQNHCRW